MIKLSKQENQLLLNYQPDRFNDARWLDDKLQQDGEVTLRHTFSFTPGDLTSAPSEDEDDGKRTFKLAVLQDGYYRINKHVLGIKHDLLLDAGMKLGSGTFIAQRNISVFRRIDELIDEPIIVGGENENAIPLADFELLLKTFPNSTELTHYARTRIARVLKDFFGTISDAEDQLNKHLNRRKRLPTESRESIVSNFEVQKFEYVHAELESMLRQVDGLSEKDWQTKILDLLLFVFPKYVAILENVHIKDFYSTVGKATDRYIDLMLVDANGSIDIIETIADVPGIMATLRLGMQLISCSDEEQKAIINSINTVLTDAFMSKTEPIDQEVLSVLSERLANLEDYVTDEDLGRDLPLDAESIEMALGIDTSGLNLITGVGSPEVDQQIYAWMQSLLLGSWHRLDHDGHIDRVQFCWRSAQGQLYLFVSGDGNAYLFQRRGLAAYLNAALLLPAEEEAITVIATREALSKIEANPGRMLN